jgi:hypothetical protein
MSHYTTLATEIVSAEHLAAALGDLGFDEVEVYDTPQPLVGWLGDSRDTEAEVIIRRRHVGLASNDIGFARNANGRFEALISDFDRHRFGPEWVSRLTQRYAYRVRRTSTWSRNRWTRTARSA